MKCSWCGSAAIEPLYHTCPQLIDGAPGLAKAQKESGMQLELFGDLRDRIGDTIVDRFTVKDSGVRQEFAGGMVRDTTEGKVDYSLVLDGPMFKRWADHLMKGAQKYQKRNWLKAQDEVTYERFRESAFRHFMQWWLGEADEDHAAAVFFNLNGAEYVKGKLDK